MRDGRFANQITVYIFSLPLRDDNARPCNGKLYIDATLVSLVRILHKDDNNNK